MPNRDGTGPIGLESITGRKNGNCNGRGLGNGQRNGQRNGQGMGFRRGQGAMRGQLQTDELTILQNQQKNCESRLDAIKNRISELSQK